MADAINLDSFDVWATIVVLVLATAATRSTFWLVGHHITIPKRVNEMLRFAPACALAAIIAPDLLMDGAQVQLDLFNLKLLSGIAATIFYLIRRNMLLNFCFRHIFNNLNQILNGR